MNKRISNIFLSRFPLWMILPLVLTVTLMTAVYWNYQRELRMAKVQYKLAAHTDAQRHGAVLASGFAELKENLNLIASLLTSADSRGVPDSSLPRQGMDVILQNVLDEIEVAAIYRLAIDLDETSDKPVSATLLQYVSGADGSLATSPAGQHSDPVKPGYRELVKHLDRIIAALPGIQGAHSFEADAVGIVTKLVPGKNGISAGRQRWYYYSVPYYRRDHRLEGIVTAVVPVTAIRAQLFPFGQALFLPGQKMTLFPLDNGPWRDSLVWIKKHVPDPTLIYSEVLPLEIGDRKERWMLWNGQPDRMFWVRNDVANARWFFSYSMAGALLLGLLFSCFLWLMKRHQLLLAKRNQQLESSLVSLRESEARSVALLRALPDIMLRIKADGTIVDISLPEGTVFPAIFPVPKKSKLHHILPRRQVSRFIQHAVTAINTGRTQLLEYCWQDEQSLRHYEARVVPCAADEVLTIVRDVTDRKKAEGRIRHLAFVDTLTGLANRQAFMQQLRERLETARRNENSVAILFIDLDQFKRVNDTLGHFVGDELIKAVARRLVNCVRKNDSIGHQMTDRNNTTMARLGGDEFTVLLDRVNKPEAAGQVARRMIKALAQPIHIDDHEIFISPSIGIALYPQDGHDEITLLKHADMAMYQAKEEGRNNYQYYVYSMSARMQERLTLENELRKAIELDQLSLYFQPQIDMRNARIVGVEALLRWHHPTLGYIAPDRFIPVAEDTGLIVEIGRWVIHASCRQYKEWQTCAIAPGRIAVNVSGQQLVGASLHEAVFSAVRTTGIRADVLELELTESALISNANEAKCCLQKMKELGVTIALDDFGTGYSSLSYLRHFPIDRLKIDRSFVSDITMDSEDVAIIRAIISMAKSLDIDVVAEGVETNAQASFLKGEGCHLMQGYLFGKPVTAEKLTFILAAEHNRPASDADAKVHRLFDSV